MPPLVTGENPFTAFLGAGLFAQYLTAALQSAAFSQFHLTPTTGAERVVFYDNTGTTPATLTTRTAALMFSDIPGCFAGLTYVLGIRNSSGSANTATVAAGSGVILTGTMTIAQFATRLFVVTMTSPAACTLQSVALISPAAA
jgi:hypothetical protein